MAYKDPQVAKANNAKWRKANPEKMRAIWRRRYARAKDKILAYHRRLYQKKYEERLAYASRYRKDHLGSCSYKASLGSVWRPEFAVENVAKCRQRGCVFPAQCNGECAYHNTEEFELSLFGDSFDISGLSVISAVDLKNGGHVWEGAIVESLRL